MSEIWAGEIGPTKHWCPYCDLLWSDEFKDEYAEHMDAHGPPATKGHMVVTGIDKDKATVTLLYCAEKLGDEEPIT